MFNQSNMLFNVDTDIWILWQTNMMWVQFVLYHRRAMCIKPNKAESQHTEQFPVPCIHWIMTGDVIDLIWFVFSFEHFPRVIFKSSFPCRVNDLNWKICYVVWNVKRFLFRLNKLNVISVGSFIQTNILLLIVLQWSVLQRAQACVVKRLWWNNWITIYPKSNILYLFLYNLQYIYIYIYV
jgi:hypothetical protein